MPFAFTWALPSSACKAFFPHMTVGIDRPVVPVQAQLISGLSANVSGDVS